MYPHLLISIKYFHLKIPCALNSMVNNDGEITGRGDLNGRRYLNIQGKHAGVIVTALNSDYFLRILCVRNTL